MKFYSENNASAGSSPTFSGLTVQYLHVDGLPVADSGAYGIHLNQVPALNSPISVIFDRAGAPNWEVGVDYLDRYFVPAYTHFVSAALAPYGYLTADLIAIDKNTRQFEMGPSVGDPSVDYPDAAFTIQGLPPLICPTVLRLDINGLGLVGTESFDMLLLQRGGSASKRWIRWTQGGGTQDWRIGMTVNAGSYDLSFFSAFGGAATPAAPGTELFRLTQTGQLNIPASGLNIFGGAVFGDALSISKSLNGDFILDNLNNDSTHNGADSKIRARVGGSFNSIQLTQWGDAHALANQGWLWTAGAANSLILGTVGTERVRINNAGNLKIVLAGVPIFINNAAAILGGLSAGYLYRSGTDPDILYIVH